MTIQQTFHWEIQSSNFVKIKPLLNWNHRPKTFVHLSTCQPRTKLLLPPPLHYPQKILSSCLFEATSNSQQPLIYFLVRLSFLEMSNVIIRRAAVLCLASLTKRSIFQAHLCTGQWFVTFYSAQYSIIWLYHIVFLYLSPVEWTLGLLVVWGYYE